jgi:hypothetical protein
MEMTKESQGKKTIEGSFLKQQKHQLTTKIRLKNKT